MFKKFLTPFSRDLGIDLGTRNTLIYTPEKGIVVNEPTVVAINLRTDEILAVGKEAQKMLGKTPPHIQVIKPLSGGAISNFEVSEKMLKHFIDLTQGRGLNLTSRTKIIIGIPLDITGVEKKAVEDITKSAGAREVHLVEEPILAAIGSRLAIDEAKAAMVVNLGAGNTEIAVISLAGVVSWKMLRLAGEELDNNIIQYIRDEFNILVGEQIAENIKIIIGSALPLKESIEMKVRGRDLVNGLPKEIILNDEQVREAINRSIVKIIENIKITLEITPPELVSDIYEQGIILTGGLAQLRGIDKAIAQTTKIPVRVAYDPGTAVIRGTGLLIDNPALLKRVEVPKEEEF